MQKKDEDFSIDPEPEQARYGAGDSDESVVEEEYQGDKVKKLKEKLRQAEEKAKEYLDNWQRDKADFLNLRKRDEEVKREFAKFAISGLVSDLLPVLDSFNLALQHDKKELEPVYKQLMQVLKSHGLEELNPVGETFDPRLHEAIGEIETDKPEDDHKIFEVIQKGYIISGKIIRPAKVRIGNFNQQTNG